MYNTVNIHTSGNIKLGLIGSTCLRLRCCSDGFAVPLGGYFKQEQIHQQAAAVQPVWHTNKITR